MAQVTPPTDEAVSVANSLVNTATIEVGVNAAILAATADQPWLGLPVIRSIFRFILTDLASYLVKYITQAVDSSIIDAQVSAEASAVQIAKTALAASEAQGDADAIAKSVQAYKDSLSHLIRTTGS